MSIEIKPEHLLAIEDAGEDGDTLAERGWRLLDGDWIYAGEHADNCPSWRVIVFSSWVKLEREIGVYRQRWDDAIAPAHLGIYARAMDAAHEALGRALVEADR